MQRTNAFAFVSGGPADVANQFAERSGCIHTRQSVQIAVVGSLADLSAPIDVGNAEAQRQPLEFPIRLALLGSEHLKVARVIHRRLDAQPVSPFVVGFNRVGFDAMFDPCWHASENGYFCSSADSGESGTL